MLRHLPLGFSVVSLGLRSFILICGAIPIIFVVVRFFYLIFNRFPFALLSEKGFAVEHSFAQFCHNNYFSWLSTMFPPLF